MWKKFIWREREREKEKRKISRWKERWTRNAKSIDYTNSLQYTSSFKRSNYKEHSPRYVRVAISPRNWWKNLEIKELIGSSYSRCAIRSMRAIRSQRTHVRYVVGKSRVVSGRFTILRESLWFYGWVQRHCGEHCTGDRSTCAQRWWVTDNRESSRWKWTGRKGTRGGASVPRKVRQKVLRFRGSKRKSSIGTWMHAHRNVPFNGPPLTIPGTDAVGLDLFFAFFVALLLLSLSLSLWECFHSLAEQGSIGSKVVNNWRQLILRYTIYWIRFLFF